MCLDLCRLIALPRPLIWGNLLNLLVFHRPRRQSNSVRALEFNAGRATHPYERSNVYPLYKFSWRRRRNSLERTFAMRCSI